MASTGAIARTAAVVGLLSSLASASWVQSIDVVLSVDTWSWRGLVVQVAVGTVLTGAGWFLAMRLVERRSAHRADRAVAELIAEVRRTGRVPEGLELASCRQALVRRRRDLTWITILCIGLGVVVTVPAGAAASRSGQQAAGIWALAVAVLIVALGTVHVVLRERRVLDGAVAQLG